MNILRRLVVFALDTIFPIQCVGCEAAGVWLCNQCRNRIPLETREVCYVCKNFSQGGQTCFPCQRIYSLSAVISFLNYDHYLVQESLRLAKYSYVKDALTPLIDAVIPQLLPKIEALDIDPRALIFVPVPLHPLRLRDRGFNQAEIIAQRVASVAGSQCVEALARRWHGPPQVSLDEMDRVRNIKGNIACKNPEAVKGRMVAVVDDVATTGSTLDACGRVLRAAGAADVWGLVLAKG